MGKSLKEDTLKKLMTEIAAQVAGLPEHLQQAAFTTLLNRALDSSTAGAEKVHKETVGKQHPTASATTLPTDTFGEYYSTFPSELSEDEKALVAASFAEAQSEDRTYTVESAHNLLKGIGIKLTNAGVYAKRLIKPKGWAIIVGKAGKKIFKFRVSNQGHKELKRLKESKT